MKTLNFTYYSSYSEACFKTKTRDSIYIHLSVRKILQAYWHTLERDQVLFGEHTKSCKTINYSCPLTNSKST